MKPHPRRLAGKHILAIIVLTLAGSLAYAQDRRPGPAMPDDSVGQLVSLVRTKAKALEGSSGMREGFQSFLRGHQLGPDSVRYSDYVIVRLLFEATRDAGFWNLHWAITDQPPNSDRIWEQWKQVKRAYALESTATAE